MFGYIVGHILIGLLISFVVIGLCWLIGWIWLQDEFRPHFREKEWGFLFRLECLERFENKERR